MTVSLTNTSGRCLVFVLAHETYCTALGECRCDVEQGRRARRTPRSLTLASGVTRAELEDAVLAVPEVARAARRNELTVKRHASSPRRPPTPAVRSPISSPEVSRLPEVARAKKKKRGAP